MRAEGQHYRETAWAYRDRKSVRVEGLCFDRRCGVLRTIAGSRSAFLLLVQQAPADRCDDHSARKLDDRNRNAEQFQNVTAEKEEKSQQKKSIECNFS